MGLIKKYETGDKVQGSAYSFDPNKEAKAQKLQKRKNVNIDGNIYSNDSYESNKASLYNSNKYEPIKADYSTIQNNQKMNSNKNAATVNAASTTMQTLGSVASKSDSSLGSALGTAGGVAGSVTGVYAVAKPIADMARAEIPKDEKTGKATTGEGVAMDEMFKATHEHMEGETSGEGMIREITGVGKVGRSITALAGKDKETTGFWGDVNKSLKREADKDMEKSLAAEDKRVKEENIRREAERKKQMGLMQEQQNYNNIVSSMKIISLFSVSCI